jgi:hypothetical protein
MSPTFTTRVRKSKVYETPKKVVQYRKRIRDLDEFFKKNLLLNSQLSLNNRDCSKPIGG